MAQTIQQRLTQALANRGETLRGHRGKYVVMTRKEGGYYFLGENGALRYGKSPSNSHSLTDTKFYKALLEPPAFAF